MIGNDAVILCICGGYVPLCPLYGNDHDVTDVMRSKLVSRSHRSLYIRPHLGLAHSLCLSILVNSFIHSCNSSNSWNSRAKAMLPLHGRNIVISILLKWPILLQPHHSEWLQLLSFLVFLICLLVFVSVLFCFVSVFCSVINLHENMIVVLDILVWPTKLRLTILPSQKKLE